MFRRTIRLMRARLAILLCTLAATPGAAGDEPAMVVDPESGKVLHAVAADRPWYPASLTKMMTLYLAFEAIERGTLTPESPLTVSPDGRRLWVPSKKDNIRRGLFRDGRPLTFQNTVRTIVRPRNHGACSATASRNAATVVTGTVIIANTTVLRSAKRNCGSSSTSAR